MTAKPKSKSRVKPATMPKPKSKTAQKPAGRRSKDAKMKFPESDVLDALSNGGNMLFDPAADEIIEPDESLLTQQEDLDEVVPLHSHELESELSEDPVRLYLREIGLVKLLDSDSEFRLATLSEADRHITALRKLKQRKGVSLASCFFHLSCPACGNVHFVGSSH